MKKIKVLHIVNIISPTSIPVELADNLNNEKFEIFILSFYDNKKEIKEQIKKNNIDCEAIGLGIKNKFNILKYIKFYKVIKKINPDIIHTHHTFSGFLGRIGGKFFTGASIVTTIHNDMRYFNFYQNLPRSLTLNLADSIVCNSNNTANSFNEWQNKLIDIDKKTVVYNGIDIEKITSCKSNNIRKKYGVDDIFLIGNVAMLEQQKDHKTLIKAFNIFESSVKDARLIIVGDGSLKEELKTLVKKLHLENKVIFVGLVTRKEVYEIINSLDLFVMSSIYEGFCNALVEAMVAHNPIIATDIEPLPEVLGEDNGLFFEKGYYKELAEKMLKVYESNNLGNELANRAVEYAVNNYSLKKCAGEYEKIYVSLCN